MANLSGRVGVTRDAWLRSVALGAPGRNGAFNDRPELPHQVLRQRRSSGHDVADPLLTGLVKGRERFAWGGHEPIVREAGWPVKLVETTRVACHV